MSGRRLWYTAEVADYLRMSVGSLYRNMRRLRELGFPRSVPGCRGRYDPRAIEGWLARQRLPSPPPPPAPIAGRTPAAGDIPAWQAEMDRRAAALGRASRAG